MMMMMTRCCSTGVRTTGSRTLRTWRAWPRRCPASWPRSPSPSQASTTWTSCGPRTRAVNETSRKFSHYSKKAPCWKCIQELTHFRINLSTLGEHLPYLLTETLVIGHPSVWKCRSRTVSENFREILLTALLRTRTRCSTNPQSSSYRTSWRSSPQPWLGIITCYCMYKVRFIVNSTHVQTKFILIIPIKRYKRWIDAYRSHLDIDDV